MDWKEKIRTIPDFPKKGILFYDITPVLQDPIALEQTISQMKEKYSNEKIDYIVGVESRGFIFGSLLAEKLGVGFIPVRKKGKLPSKTIEQSYALEYGTATIEIHEDALKAGDRVLVADDLLATGGTAQATAALVQRLGGNLVGFCFLIELSFLNGRKKLEPYHIESLVQFDQ
ncbi:adenine phosphoribosyltransferase [Candidatus Micrarchaeota archaeon]|nr:adenine phosphoribosyltransferase [Candidatus Micrarchaeota archaeon]MBU1930617.1 adenine phosphoribosyltransferase [Candidatus Micrarchaeota archaeon]